MGNLSRHDPQILGLGANAGAIRPASGYTFVFMHQQIQRAIEDVNKGKEIEVQAPTQSSGCLDGWSIVNGLEALAKSRSNSIFTHG